jgi:hypothetical protein
LASCIVWQKYIPVVGSSARHIVSFGVVYVLNEPDVDEGPANKASTSACVSHSHFVAVLEPDVDLEPLTDTEVVVNGWAVQFILLEPALLKGVRPLVVVGTQYSPSNINPGSHGATHNESTFVYPGGQEE